MSQQLPTRPMSEASPAPAPADVAYEAADEEAESDGQLLKQYVPSWVTSFVLHASIIISIALIPIFVHEKETMSLVAGDAGQAVETSGEINMDPLGNLSEALDQQTAIEVSNLELRPLSQAPQIENISEQLSLSEFLDPTASGLASSTEPMSAALSGGSEFAGRAAAGKGEGAKKIGVTDVTEDCVALGLQWLAAHQLEDGSWNFNHQIGPGDRSSPDPGQYDKCPIAATAMCLMAFLGNGQTHLNGAYKEQVRRALNYLIKTQLRGNDLSGSLVDPDRAGMYSHGLATIALAEAYGMTKDPMLYDPAQDALAFIAYAQNNEGGWRYSIKEPGDLSVSGWMIMAIKSGLMSDLDVPNSVTKKSARFLDSVSESDSGAKYSYRPDNQGTSPNMTAVGLLCRMYMGWKHDHPSLERGVQYLARTGPQIGESTNMYFNFYATQVLRQYGGPEWTKWNSEMSAHLVKTQSREGVTKGSWMFDAGTDRGPAAGGRIYCTAMSVMTLEVYYRFLPIYGDQAMQDEFPLD